MKTGAWITLVVILAVIVAGFWLVRSTEPDSETELEGLIPETSFSPPPVAPFTSVTPAPTASPSGSPVAEAVTIAVDETGFTPATVTIKAGTEVTFVNNGQGNHWPASDVHPTHQILPAFDAKRGLATGETYSFTFTETGTWPCHDHLAPSSKCTIVVEE